MIALRTLDKAHVSPRDVIMLWALREQKGAALGMMGQELAKKIGLPTRSNVQDNIRRLIRFGYIEDRRKTVDRKTPNNLHILPAGEHFLECLLPS